MVNSKRIFYKNEQIILREEFDDWALLFNPDTGKVFGVNQVAAAIWKLIDGTRTLEDISAEIKLLCPDAPDAIHDDIEEFLSKTEEIGFTRVKE